MPAPIFPNLVVIHAQFTFRFFKTLLYWPTKATEPNECGKSGAEGRITQKIAEGRISFNRTPYDEPDFLVWHAVFGKDNPPFGKFILNRPLCPFGNLAAIPEEIIEALGQGSHCDGLFFSAIQNLYFPYLAFILVFLFSCNRRVQPAIRVRWD